MRIVRLTLAAALATSALAFVPGAQAQLVCRTDRAIHTTDFTIYYPTFHICR